MKLLKLSLLLVGICVCHATYAMDGAVLHIHEKPQQLIEAKNLIDNADQSLKYLETVVVTNYRMVAIVKQVQEHMKSVDQGQKIAQGIMYNEAFLPSSREEATVINRKACALQNQYALYKKTNS